MTISKKAPLMAFVLGLGLVVSMSSFKASHSVSDKKVNPQWFTYNLDPTLGTFSSDKLVASNYTATGITNPSTGSAPCSGNARFCAIYAETVSSTQPDLTSGQPIRDELDDYTNGAGQSSILRQKANP